MRITSLQSILVASVSAFLRAFLKSFLETPIKGSLRTSARGPVKNLSILLGLGFLVGLFDGLPVQARAPDERKGFKEFNDTPLLAMGINEVQEIPLGPQDEISIDKKDIIRLKVNGATLKLQGHHLGQTLLKVGKRPYLIAVLTDDQIEIYYKLKQFTHQHPHLVLSYQKNLFLIKGKISHPSDWLTLATLNLHGFEIQAAVSSDHLKTMEFFINRALVNKGHYPIQLGLEPHPTVRLAASLLGNDSLNEELGHFGVHLVNDPRQIRPEPLVRVHIMLAEVRKSLSEGLGIEWPYKASAQILPQGIIPKEEGLSFMAQFFAREGHGRILAHPLLLTKSGTEAEFFAGGEFPIETHSRQSHQVIWKKYGIALKIKPRADPDGKISLDVSSEISSIDTGERGDGVPSLFTNTMSSHFDLERAQTIALSGLIKKVSGQSLKEYPGLGEIPVLGSLFKSTDYQEDKTELLVLVSPEIVHL